ncbi:DUF6884 domain-containing protein [Streptomyces goshikiensis]|uniref:DUF6884 domain-containing protein n=1 Tax=Streptomyces goshikiensis TaxID=1942 RepID=UPI0036B3BA0F
MIACGQKKALAGVDADGRQLRYPAGELYVGAYHRSLRRAADALTDPALIRVVSALHGLLPLERNIAPYDVSVGDETAMKPERLLSHTAALGTHDADVIFLGGGAYATLLQASIPHLYAPLTGGIGTQRGQCREASESAGMRTAWWQQAAQAFNEHQGSE